MEYFSGLDVSLEKTHVFLLDRDGTVGCELTAPTSPTTIATVLDQATA